ncbi:MAG TPA: HAMP domain-containing sensor histidine kinase [Pyrinomonadaceae bacterium]|nr:HAMP domain-containing sensor histidine kinase [Pyrinomonadaceae bacterium]
MKSKRRKFWRDNRFRLLLTLELAVMLPAAALIYVNFSHLHSIMRGKKVEALIHRDFQYVLGVSEKRINQEIYAKTEEVRGKVNAASIGKPGDVEKELDEILYTRPWIAHLTLFDRDKGAITRSQPRCLNDPSVHEEHEAIAKGFPEWFNIEGKMLAEQIRKKPQQAIFSSGPAKRNGAESFMTTAVFIPQNASDDHLVLAAASFEPDYLKETFFPSMLHELITQKLSEDDDEPLAMMVFPTPPEGFMSDPKPLVVSPGWGSGKAEVTRNLDNVFRGLSLGIKFQGTTADAIGRRWAVQSFWILGVLSVLMIGGLILAYRSVNREMSLARLKSDFVSNVSHELRTPLALIRLYAETLELGRITTSEKKEEYYRIIRKESERLSALINNILDFSRIEAGRKEYDFRETDIAELVRNTLDTYRYQIEQQGFSLEENLAPGIPRVRVDREAIARALVNLVNNALKYSANEKFLGVKLYRQDDDLKLEVSDRGIGIPRREQGKIFEKFYRTGDPLVHNTKGSGLGLALVRHITDAHGGDVQVESTPGKGSKFTLSLPLSGPPQLANETA